MKTSSIKTKLLFTLSVVIVISFLVLGINTANTEFEKQYHNIKKEELLLSKQSAMYVNAFLQSKIDIVQSYAQKVVLNDLDKQKDELIRSFAIGKEAGDFVDIYLGLEENGYFLSVIDGLLTPQKDDYDPRARPWYKEAVIKGKPGISSPYVDRLTKKLVITVFAPYKKDGKLVGVFASDIFIDTIVKAVNEIKLKKTGYAYLVDENGKILVHKDKKILNKEDKLFKSIKEKDTKIQFKEVEYNDVDLLTVYASVPSADWYLVTRLEKQEISDEIVSDIIKDIVIYIILLIVILLVVYYTLKKLLNPLGKLQEGLIFFFKYLNGQESQVKLLEIQTNDEFGQMAGTINKEMKAVETSLNEDRVLIEEVKDVVHHINKGKLDVQVQKSTSNKALNELKDILNEMIETINENVNSDINPILDVLEQYSNLDFTQSIKDPDGKVSRGLNTLNEMITNMLQANKTNGLTLNNNAQTLLENVDSLNRSSNETAASLEETAAAVEEITSTIANNTNRIAEMSNYSKELIHSIDQGQKLASSTVTSMDEINEQTQSIADAITVIDQIAFQTNILSLNAAVEAATAGEAGKGFAVVAQEVRNLASRSAEAAKEIKDLVESATLKTNSGKQIADDMIKGYTKLNEDIEKTTAAVDDIAESSKEQRISIEQINDVINRLDQETQKNASVASQTQNIAQDTSHIASEILAEVNKKKFRE